MAEQKEQPSIVTGASKSLGFKEGVYDNLTENIAGIGVIAIPAFAVGTYMAAKSLKKGLKPEEYAKARSTSNGVLRLAMPA